MKKVFSVVYALLFLVTLASCGREKLEPDIGSETTQIITEGTQTVTVITTEYLDIYIKAIERLIVEDPALNNNMKYIAIEMSTLKGINKSDEAELIKYFEDRYVEVKNVSLDDLKKAGEFDEKYLYLKNGIAIRVYEVIEFTEDSIVFSAIKYKSGFGAVGFTFKFSSGQAGWEMIEVGMKLSS